MSGVNITGNNYNTLVDQHRQQHYQVATMPFEQTISTDTFTKNNDRVINNINFTGDETEIIQQPQKSHTFRNIVLSVIGLFVAGTGVALHVGGGIKNAFKNKEIVSTAKKGFNQIFKVKNSGIVKPVDNVMIPHKKQGVFTVSKDGSVITCTIPGKQNYSYNIKTHGSVAEQARKIGLKTNSGTVPKNATIKSYSYTYKNGLCKYTVTVTNNQNIVVRNSRGKTVKLDKNSLEKIRASVDKAAKGDTKTLKDYVVQTYKITENGVTSQYKRQSGSYKISSFITDKFAIDSDEVVAYCAKTPEAKTLLNAVKHRQSNLNRISGEVTCRLGTFKIANGEIIGLTEKGIYYPNTDAHFIALEEKNQQLFKDILENKYKYKSETFGL